MLLSTCLFRHQLAREQFVILQVLQSGSVNISQKYIFANPLVKQLDPNHQSAVTEDNTLTDRPPICPGTTSLNGKPWSGSRDSTTGGRRYLKAFPYSCPLPKIRVGKFRRGRWEGCLLLRRLHRRPSTRRWILKRKCQCGVQVLTSVPYVLPLPS